MKFVDVKNDVAFHKIFGNANKTIALISFLNAVLMLKNDDRIQSVVIENPYQFPLTTGGKISIIDIGATDQLGRKFIVEMQVADKTGFIKRAQYYAARDYSMQIDEGDDYPQLKPTHFVGILNFNITQGEHYFSHHITVDAQTGEHLLKDVQYFFIELLKFDKKADDLENMIDKWTFFIKNAPRIDMLPSNIQDPGLRTAYQEADKIKWTRKELKAYDDAGVRATDIIQERMRAVEIGMEKGVEIGMEKKEIETVINAYKKGKNAETISEFLDIPLSKVIIIIENYLKIK
jgi:predicted transposase/invertase (TIGR01784 family)